MNTWSQIFLGVIAVATLATAIVQVGLLVAAGLLARRLARLVDQVEREIKPVFGHLNAIARDASRAAEVATAQMERVDRLFADLAERMDQTFSAFQATLAVPAREGRAVLSALRAAVRAVRDFRSGATGRRSRSEEEDALFI